MNGASFKLPIGKPDAAPPKPGFVEMYMSSEGVLMVRNSDDVHAPLESARELIGKPNGLVSTNENEHINSVGTDFQMVYGHRTTGVNNAEGIIPGEIQIVLNSVGVPMDLSIGYPNIVGQKISLSQMFYKTSVMNNNEISASDIYLYDPWTKPSGVLSNLIHVASSHASGTVNIHGMVRSGYAVTGKTEPDDRFPNVMYMLHRGLNGNSVTIKHLSEEAPPIQTRIFCSGAEDIVMNLNDIVLFLRTSVLSNSSYGWVAKKL